MLRALSKVLSKAPSKAIVKANGLLARSAESSAVRLGLESAALWER